MNNNEYIIYIYYNDDNNILYIGKTNNFTQRQKEHLQRGEEYMFYFSYVEKYLFNSELYRDIYELFLINKEKPYYNEQGIVKKVSEEEIHRLEEFLPQGELVERIFRNDAEDFLMKRNIFLPDVENLTLVDFTKFIYENYPESSQWGKEEVYNFLFKTEQGWNLYLEKYYLKVREKWYTETQYKNNLSRFKQNQYYICVTIILHFKLNINLFFKLFLLIFL